MKKRPNILFVLIDDMGWRDLAYCGSSFYETPNIDRLARRGMVFTVGYAACPVCSPTRASLLSGQYPAHVGVTDWIAHQVRPDSDQCGHARGRLIDAPYVDHLPKSEDNLACVLQRNGYQTWHIGKWHLGNEDHWPEHQGFDVNVGGNEFGMPRAGYFSPWQLPNLPGTDVPEDTYLDDYLTDRAIDLLKTRDAARPFFMNLWYYLVHTPIQAKAELIAKYEAKARRLKLDQIDPLVPGERHHSEHKRHVPVMRRIIQSHPVYAAMVEILDQNVGRMMDALEAEGLAEDTMIVFSSDNGGLATSEGSPTCNAPLAEGKGWMYEGGTRVPMFFTWPGHIAPGLYSSEPISSPDLYATMLDAADAVPTRSDDKDGCSVLPILEGDATALDREALYWHYPHYGNQGGTPGSSIRSGDWKLMEFFEDQRLELYHLGDDPSESRNRVEDQPEIAGRLHRMLKKWQQDMNAKIPVSNPHWIPGDDPAANPLV